MCEHGHINIAVDHMWISYCHYKLNYTLLEYAVLHSAVIRAICKFEHRSNKYIAIVYLFEHGDKSIIHHLFQELQLQYRDYAALWKRTNDPTIMRILIQYDVRKIGLQFMNCYQMNILLRAGMSISWFVTNADHLEDPLRYSILLHKNVIDMTYDLVRDVTHMPADLCNIVNEYIG
jgi:hypothetical protein